MSEQTEIWVVDRVESGIAVLVEDDEEQEELAVIEVAAALLGAHAVEGAILRVPLGSVGDPLWDQATRDTDSEAARLDDAERTLKELKKRDPGGDIEL